MGKDEKVLDDRGIGGLSALGAAIKSSRKSSRHITEILIERGASITIPAVEGISPLVMSLESENTDVEVVGMLISAGADLTEKVGEMTLLEMCNGQSPGLDTVNTTSISARAPDLPSLLVKAWQEHREAEGRVDSVQPTDPERLGPLNSFGWDDYQEYTTSMEDVPYRNTPRLNLADL